MNLVRKHWKTAAITFLVLLTLFQTENIWFEGRSVADLLEIFGGSGRYEPSEAELRLFSKPTAIYTGLNDGRYSMIMSGVDDTSAMGCFTQLMRGFFASGQFGGEAEMSEELLSGSDLVMRYEYLIPADVLTRCFAQSQLLSQRMNLVEYIAVKREGTELIVSFFGPEAGLSYSFSDESVLAAMDALPVEGSALSDIYYSMSFDYQYGAIFDGLCFVAEWGEDRLAYELLNVVDPFYDDSNVFVSSLQQSKVSGLFENPSAVMVGYRNDSHIYSDESSRVNVYANGLLEYSLPAAAVQAEPDEFMPALSAAYAMIARDATVVNDVYLASADSGEDGYTFGFNCVVGDIPIYVPANDGFFGELGLSHNIEVSVAGGQVRSYRRYVSVFEPDAEVNSGRSFNQLIGSELSGDEEDWPYLSGLTLGYYMNGASQLGLSWSMSYTDGTNFDAVLNVLNDEVTE